MDRPAVVEIASELERLLLQNHPAQAEFVRDLGASVAKDDLLVAGRLFSSLQMWGGPGSVADVSLLSPAANERMNNLLVQLVQYFEEVGITYPRAAMWASVFKKWERLGVFRK